MRTSHSIQKDLDRVRNKILKINEIFFSIQGESTKTGLPTIFIRLTGCPLRCVYCDTEYAFHEGEKMSIDDILHKIAGFRTRHVTVTGGEPLAQKACIDLLGLLCDEGYLVSLETSGAVDISTVDERVSRIVDIKTPGSGEVNKNKFGNLKYITPHDQIKFVICDRMDYLWAKDKLKEFQLNEHCEVLFSPSHGVMNAVKLADWILEDHLPVRFQIQLHKYLWGDVPGK
ncbi:MAG: 7-carboxy-7-deazaguanine synthase QueE [Gammaproteobacteria bacterium]|nr:7-carboxy-7-deazaguanine synthase QueE [Gammaproteobacteria bacterium]